MVDKADEEVRKTMESEALFQKYLSKAETSSKAKAKEEEDG